MFNLFNQYFNRNIEVHNSKYSFINSISNELQNYLNKYTNMYSIDELENNFAICENLQTGKFENIPIDKLPKNVLEGDILEFKNGKYIINDFETQKRKEYIKEKFNKLWDKK